MKKNSKFWIKITPLLKKNVYLIHVFKNYHFDINLVLYTLFVFFKRSNYILGLNSPHYFIKSP